MIIKRTLKKSRVELLQNRSLSKPERIKTIIDGHIGKISKKQIAEQCPDISVTTIERALADLVKTGYIKKIGAGRATAYIKTDALD